MDEVLSTVPGLGTIDTPLGIWIRLKSMFMAKRKAYDRIVDSLLFLKSRRSVLLYFLAPVALSPVSSGVMRHSCLVILYTSSS